MGVVLNRESETRVAEAVPVLASLAEPEQLVRIGGPVALGEDRLVIFKVRNHHKSEVKPLADGRIIGIGGINAERGRGDHFWFELTTA